LFSSLEILETQSAAVLQFLKDKGIATDDELARHLEQAGMASSVKRLAARVRMDYLLSGVTNPPRKAAESDGGKIEAKAGEATAHEENREKTNEKGSEKNPEGRKDNSESRPGEISKAEKDTGAKADQDENEQGKFGVDSVGGKGKKQEQPQTGVTPQEESEKVKNKSERKPAHAAPRGK